MRIQTDFYSRWKYERQLEKLWHISPTYWLRCKNFFFQIVSECYQLSRRLTSYLSEHTVFNPNVLSSLFHSKVLYLYLHSRSILSSRELALSYWASHSCIVKNSYAFFHAIACKNSTIQRSKYGEPVNVSSCAIHSDWMETLWNVSIILCSVNFKS